MKLYISAMSESKKEMERWFYAHTAIVVEHIIKLSLMPEHPARNHWMQEIATQIKEVSKLKGSNKFPSSEQIYKWTYYKRQDLVTDVRWMSVTIQDLEDDYGFETNLSTRYICKYVDSICSKYFKWLCDKLSLTGKVANYDIYNKLNSLIQN